MFWRRRRPEDFDAEIGARRSRPIRQMLVGSGLLGVTGGVLGAALAWNASRLLIRMVSPDSTSIPMDITLDAQVFTFTLSVVLLTVLLFGTVPAFYATRLEVGPALKGGRGIVTTAAHNLFSRGCIVCQWRCRWCCSWVRACSCTVW